MNLLVLTLRILSVFISNVAVPRFFRIRSAKWLKCALHFIVHKLKCFHHGITTIDRAWTWCFFACTMNQLCSSGIEGNPTVFYRLMPGSTAQTNKFHTFYLQQRPDNGDTWADIKVNHPLDYESIKEYNLTIRVEVSNFNCIIFILIVFFNNNRIKTLVITFQKQKITLEVNWNLARLKPMLYFENIKLISYITKRLFNDQYWIP